MNCKPRNLKGRKVLISKVRSIKVGNVSLRCDLSTNQSHVSPDQIARCGPVQIKGSRGREGLDFKVTHYRRRRSEAP